MYAYADWKLKRRPQPIVMQRLPICLDSEKGARCDTGARRAPRGPGLKSAYNQSVDLDCVVPGDDRARAFRSPAEASVAGRQDVMELHRDGTSRRYSSRWRTTAEGGDLRGDTPCPARSMSVNADGLSGIAFDAEANVTREIRPGVPGQGTGKRPSSGTSGPTAVASSRPLARSTDTASPWMDSAG